MFRPSVDDKMKLSGEDDRSLQVAIFEDFLDFKMNAKELRSSITGLSGAYSIVAILTVLRSRLTARNEGRGSDRWRLLQTVSSEDLKRSLDKLSCNEEACNFGDVTVERIEDGTWHAVHDKVAGLYGEALTDFDAVLDLADQLGDFLANVEKRTHFGDEDRS